ncbi:MAG: DMT family transporter [Sphingomonadales bacterium]|nr:DMT family transporter [Sphingomonadales bacterium]
MAEAETKTSKNSEASAGPLAFLILGILSLLWGSSFILMKRILPVFPPMELATLRIGMAGLAMVPLWLWHMRSEHWRRLPWFAVVGLVGNGIPALLFATAQTGIDSGAAGVLNALTPMFTLVVGWAFFGGNAQRSQVLGLVLGLVGAVLLILSQHRIQSASNPNLALLLVLATFFYGISVNTVGHRLRGISPWLTASLPLVIASVPAWITLWWLGDLKTPMQQEGAWTALYLLFFLSLVNSAFSLVAFNYLIHIAGPLFASTTTYLMPVVALLWAYWDGETLSLYHLTGLMAIVGGITMINQRR